MEDITPQTKRSSRKAGILGGVIGSVGLAASIFALTAVAGASTSTIAAQDVEPVPTPAEDVEADVEQDLEDEFTEEHAAAEACWNGIAEKFGFGVEGEIDHETFDWDAVDSATEACDDLLPQDVKDQIAADEALFEEYDTCMDAAFEASGIDIEGTFGGIEMFDGDIGMFPGGIEMFDGDIAFDAGVSVFDGDENSFATFGEGDGTITITKLGDDIAVTTDGDVNVETFSMADLFDGDLGELNFGGIDIEALGEGDFEAFEFPGDEELEKALSGCDDKLPEGIDFHAGFEMSGHEEELANS